MMADLMSDMGGAEGGIDMVEGMMESLLSKEVMYPSLTEVATKVSKCAPSCSTFASPHARIALAQFPAWLEANRASLEKAQLEAYEQQFGCMQQILAVYEEANLPEQEQVARVMDLMDKVGCHP